ncbi:hypothetical protein CBR_g6485 [Chara braunii]|uniref:Uncharacterized protein n=1 Tax=Chara braunii TaxID=69332 RepID=A0A388KJZ5_CHABU|nr:hypothetical protein CBR_g6485 [Chara braunii]|eukprot:GBG70357.1 hypothetical protein CBR_g6485 [Chara braunii]
MMQSGPRSRAEDIEKTEQGSLREEMGVAQDKMAREEDLPGSEQQHLIPEMKDMATSGREEEAPLIPRTREVPTTTTRGGDNEEEEIHEAEEEERRGGIPISTVAQVPGGEEGTAGGAKQGRGGRATSPSPDPTYQSLEDFLQTPEASEMRGLKPGFAAPEPLDEPLNVMPSVKLTIDRAKEYVQDASQTATEKLVSGLVSVKDVSAKAIGEMKEKAMGTGEVAKEKVVEGASGTKETLEHLKDRAVEGAEEVAEGVKDKALHVKEAVAAKLASASTRSSGQLEEERVSPRHRVMSGPPPGFAAPPKVEGEGPTIGEVLQKVTDRLMKTSLTEAVRKTVSTATDATTEGVETVKERSAETLEAVKSKVGETKDAFKCKGEEAKEALKLKGEEAKDKAAEMAGSLKEGTLEKKREVEEGAKSKTAELGEKIEELGEKIQEKAEGYSKEHAEGAHQGLERNSQRRTEVAEPAAGREEEEEGEKQELQGAPAVDVGHSAAETEMATKVEKDPVPT